jgi:hypothetical protein
MLPFAMSLTTSRNWSARPSPAGQGRPKGADVARWWPAIASLGPEETDEPASGMEKEAPRPSLVDPRTGPRPENDGFAAAFVGVVDRGELRGSRHTAARTRSFDAPARSRPRCAAALGAMHTAGS